MTNYNPRQAQLKQKHLHVKFPYHPYLVDQIREIVPEGRKWDEETGIWTLKVSLQSIQFLIKHNFEIPPRDAERLLNILNELVLKEQNQEKRAVLSKATEAPPIQSIADRMRLPAWDYQWAPVHYGELSDFRFMLCDEMSIGKSVQALMVADHDAVRKKPKLVVTPVPDTFQNEIHKFFKGASMICEKPLYSLYPRIEYYILTYDRLHYIVDDPRGQQKPRDFVKEFFPIIDEVHLAKNPTSRRNQLLHAILNESGIDERLLMTGSPVMNRPSEVFELMRLLNGRDSFTWWDFMRKFCNMHTTDKGYLNTNGSSNLQELNNYLYNNIFVRREKQQVQSQLPEKIRQSYNLKKTPVDLTADTVFEMYAKSAAYKAQDKDFLEWMETAIDAATKIGIFVHHKVMMKAMEDLFKRMGKKYIKIDGSVPKNERQKLCLQFANDPNISGALLSLHAAGTGLNGLQVAEICCFPELYYVPGTILQAEERFHRPGLKNALLVAFPLVTKFEYRLCELILQKIGIIKRVTGHEAIPDSLKEDTLIKVIAKEFGLPLGRIKEQ